MTRQPRDQRTGRDPRRVRQGSPNWSRSAARQAGIAELVEIRGASGQGSAKQVEILRPPERCRTRTVVVGDEPFRAADEHDRLLRRLPAGEIRGCRELIGDGDLGGAQLTPVSVRLSAEVFQYDDARGADGDVRDAQAPSAAKRIRY